MSDSNDTDLVLERFSKLLGAQSYALKDPRGLAPDAPVFLLPKGLELKSVKSFLDEYLPRPARRDGTARLDTLDSFIDHTKRFASKDSVVFANSDPRTPTLTAVLDYHAAGHESAASWSSHRALYSFPLSDEWKTWAGKIELAQAEFAAFLEDRLGDVIDPESVDSPRVEEFAQGLGISLAAPSQLLTLSRGLEVSVGHKVTNSVNLSTGERSLQFVEEHKDSTGQKLKVPGGFVVVIPVFQGDGAYPLPIRLRYKIVGGAVVWTLQAQRADLVFRDAFDRAAAYVAEKTELPLLRGAPESSR